MRFLKSSPIIFTVFFLGFSIAFAYFLIRPRIIETTLKPARVSQTLSSQQPENKTIIIIFVGDIMLDRGVEYMIKKEGKDDFRFSFLKIADYLKKADIVFGNLEGPISNKGIQVGSIYSFRMAPEAINGLTYAGFNILSLSNNHAFDYGRQALEDTFSRLKAANINYVGSGFNKEEAYSPVIKEISGTKIAFLSFTDLGPLSWQASENSSGIALLSEEKLKESVKTAKEKADIVIVSFHMGQEYQKEPSETQKYFSRLAIDYGADLVIGNHPHVVQTNENYKNGFIFYSLGNFIFDQGFSKETMESQIVKAFIENKKIKEIKPEKIIINNYFQPELQSIDFTDR